MFVYANLLGVWTELSDSDKINGSNPQIYASDYLLNTKDFASSDVTNDFLEITIEKDIYYVHKSCIQITKKV